MQKYLPQRFLMNILREHVCVSINAAQIANLKTPKFSAHFLAEKFARNSQPLSYPTSKAVQQQTFLQCGVKQYFFTSKHQVALSPWSATSHIPIHTLISTASIVAATTTPCFAAIWTVWIHSLWLLIKKGMAVNYQLAAAKAFFFNSVACATIPLWLHFNLLAVVLAGIPQQPL